MYLRAILCTFQIFTMYLWVGEEGGEGGGRGGELESGWGGGGRRGGWRGGGAGEGVGTREWGIESIL